ncbi:MAG: hypothetical protein M1274_11100 [Actinobacteria bacterium]|nr:hypothetical protein [Actinomycetota bacterium]
MSHLVGYPYQFSPGEIVGWRRYRRAAAWLSSLAFVGIIALVAYLYITGSSTIPTGVLGFMATFAVIGCVNSYLLGVRGSEFRPWDLLGLVVGQVVLYVLMMVTTSPGYWATAGASVVLLLVATYALTCATSPGTRYGRSGSALVLISGLNSLLLATLVVFELGPAVSLAGRGVRVLLTLLGIYAILMARRTFLVYQMTLQGIALLGISAGVVAGENSLKLLFIPIIATILLSGTFLTLAVKFPPAGLLIEQARRSRASTGRKHPR